MMKFLVSQETTVKELLDDHPETLKVFMDLGLMCPGCPAEGFHTLADVVREYHLELNQLLRHFQKAMEDGSHEWDESRGDNG